MNGLSILVPAAGASSRMGGRDKLLEKVAGVPLLRRQVLRARDTGAPVIVTLPPAHGQRSAVIADIGCTCIEVPDAGEGMAASLRAGARVADPDHALMVLLPDMPDITTDDIRTLALAHATAPQTVHRAVTAGGQAGHPVILPARLRPAMAGLRGDEGAWPLLRSETVILVPLDGDRAVIDLDTPGAWARWRARER